MRNRCYDHLALWAFHLRAPPHGLFRENVVVIVVLIFGWQPRVVFSSKFCDACTAALLIRLQLGANKQSPGTA